MVSLRVHVNAIQVITVGRLLNLGIQIILPLDIISCNMFRKCHPNLLTSLNICRYYDYQNLYGLVCVFKAHSKRENSRLGNLHWEHSTLS